MQAISAGLAPDLREIDSHGTGMANATRRKGCFAKMDGICVAEVLVVAVFSCHHLVTLNQEAIGTVRAYLEAPASRADGRLLAMYRERGMTLVAP